MYQPNFRKQLNSGLYQALIWGIFLIGLWLIVIRPLGPGLARIPGDLADSRFNNYILEHFFRWVTGLDKSYWNATFFYPFPQTISFGDNLLGSAPIYALFRWSGLDMQTAFQGWYILGYLFNYAAAVGVLLRLKLKPLAVVVGAFFFAFGLPLLSQELHLQLFYRFCVPLTCLCLWEFSQQPRLLSLLAASFFLVWQCYLSIYIGIFLFLLLVTLVVLLPFFTTASKFKERISYWPLRLKEAWIHASRTGRMLSFLGFCAVIAGWMVLFLPYYQNSKAYGFSRTWDVVELMLPRVQSYFLADHSALWIFVSKLFPDFPLRYEHQLFPGFAVVILLVTGIFWRFSTKNRTIAMLHLWAVLVLVVLTLDIGGFSLYRGLWWLPGLNSIRAVSRIQLVLMWPMGLFIAVVIDAFLRLPNQRYKIMTVMAVLYTVLIIAEPALFFHTTFLKTDAQSRLVELREQIPASTPQNPVLFVVDRNGSPWWWTEIDGMLLAQELGWPTLNGYSGNFPWGFDRANTGVDLPQRIQSYMQHAKITDPSFFEGLMKRVVSIGN
jgi:hypothetical protein